jgi:hypothetical protein
MTAAQKVALQDYFDQHKECCILPAFKASSWRVSISRWNGKIVETFQIGTGETRWEALVQAREWMEANPR